MNVVFLYGNLGADPEVRELENGDVVANLRLATNKSWTDGKGNRQKKTTWHDVAVWGRQGEIAEEYLKKGDAVIIQGEITEREYEKDGERRFARGVKCLPYGLVLLSNGQFTEAEDQDDEDRSSRRSKRQSNRSNKSTSRSRSRSRSRDEDEGAEEDSSSTRTRKRSSRSRRSKPEFSE